MFLKLFLLGFFIAFLLFLAYQADKRKKRIVFLGDSITQQGSMAGGFIGLLQDCFKNENLTNYEFINAGIGGNKVTDLVRRADKDVAHKNPKLAIIMIGVNDVWHKMQGTGNNLSHFEEQYRELINKLLRSQVNIILCTPTVIGEQHDGSNYLNEALEDYCEVVRKLSTEFHFPLCDARNAFLHYLRENNPEHKYAGVLTSDGVHLNDKGNHVLAKAIWEVLRQQKLSNLI